MDFMRTDFVSRIFCFTYICGVFLWQSKTIYRLYMSIRGKIFIRRSLSGLSDGNEFRRVGKIDFYVENLIYGGEMSHFFPSAKVLYGCCLILATSVFFIFWIIAGCKLGIAAGLFLGSCPILAVAVRLHSRRVARSQEGDVIVQEILNNYKIFDYNMKEAIEKTTLSIDGAPYGKKLLVDLSRKLQNAVTENEFNEALEAFRYSLDTSWGNILSNNIKFSYLYGIRVDEALEDLAVGISKSREIVQHSKRENNEANLILKYLVPGSLILSVAGAKYYFGFTLTKYMKYQFCTPLGIRWFVIICIVYGVSVAINMLISKEKMDL